MRGLFLYGAKCNVHVWDKIAPAFNNISIQYVSYPHEVTQNAKNISDIAEWIYKHYNDTQYDFILGHSMGGSIAWKLIFQYKMDISKIILVESNPMPSNAFYRNLLTDNHMKQYGETIKKSFLDESTYYSSELLSTLQDDFDETNYVRQYNGKIFSIYGDRGMPQYERKIEDLCLQQDILDKMQIFFVKDSCHMPMIENPKDFSDIVRRILLDK